MIFGISLNVHFLKFQTEPEMKQKSKENIFLWTQKPKLI